ncbi:MAG TPA: HigA family addiction module antitoxin [Armatimonadota bacterium]|jgi:HTH-type transcriptional regulator/antitoxin HigA
MSHAALRPARATPPGRILAQELDERGWSQSDLADVLGRPPSAVSGIVSGASRITPETARSLAAALGTSAELWMNLETAYRLSEDPQAAEDEVRRRSALYDRFPIREMIRRGWIAARTGAADLESEVLRFFQVQTLDEISLPALCARRSTKAADNPDWLLAWRRRVEMLCAGQTLGPYDVDALSAAIPGILALSVQPESVGGIGERLGELGIHFVLLRHLPRTRLDGASFLHPDQHPVIALTARFGRLDHFWFTLAHELAHVALGHVNANTAFYDAMGDFDEGEAEKQADKQASEWLAPERSYRQFSVSAALSSPAAIRSFADSIERHPGIVVGRLQHDQILPYTAFRSMLPDIRTYMGPLMQ